MKKKIVMAIGTIAGAAVLGLGIYHSEASQSDSGLTTEEIKEQVTAQYPGEIKDIHLNKQANKSVYKVDIENTPRAYTLTVDGSTGEVMELLETSDPEKVKIAEKKEKEEKEKKKKEKQANEKQTEKSTQKEAKQSKKQESNGNKSKSEEKKKTVISVDEATSIAMEQFSGKIDEVELEEEDGRLIYEIEIENGEDEAEIEIDAYTGEVLVVSIERD